MSTDRNVGWSAARAFDHVPAQHPQRPGRQELKRNPIEEPRRGRPRGRRRCAGALRKAQDNTPNNYESIGVVVTYGSFRYLDLADLTSIREAATSQGGITHGGGTKFASLQDLAYQVPGMLVWRRGAAEPDRERQQGSRFGISVRFCKRRGQGPYYPVHP